MHLAHLDRHDGDAPWGDTPPEFVPREDPLTLQVRGRLARQSRQTMRRLGRTPPISLGTGIAAPGPARVLQRSFLEGPSPTKPARAAREMPWRLAVVGQALAELWQRRGLPDVPFLLPLSVDLRRKGEAGPVFGNCLAFHFARFTPSDTRDLHALAAALRRQMADALREGQIEANRVGMDFVRLRRLSRMLDELPWTRTGETFSFNCADIGDFPPALETLFGRRVLSAYHAPTVVPKPGVGLFFNRCAGRSNLVVSWVEGVLSEEEAAGIIEHVRSAMGWREIR
jgi:hypothetical protein